MNRKKELALILLLGTVCLGILVMGSGGEAGAAYPTSQSKPQYQDPSPSFVLRSFFLRHLSGVVAVPPSTMIGEHGMGGGTSSVGAGDGALYSPGKWAGP